jgi:hypothetical protein
MSVSTITKTNLDVTLFTRSAFYFFWIPLGMPYNKTMEQAKESGFEIDGDFGIIEKASFIGRGWIGVSVKNHQDKSNLVPITGEFHTLEILGEYSQIKSTYQNIIMKDYPQAKEFYNIYYNDPKLVKTEDLKTKIIWR